MNYHQHSNNSVAFNETLLNECNDNESLLKADGFDTEHTIADSYSCYDAQGSNNIAQTDNQHHVMLNNMKMQIAKQKETLHSLSTKLKVQGPGPSNARKNPEKQFPMKLYALLELAADQYFGHSSGAIVWLPHGRAFKILDEDIFMEKVVPLIFRQTRIRSFYRQLYLWGFERMSSGPDVGAWYNKNFILGCPDKIKNMVRIKIKSSLNSSTNCKEPSFYAKAPIITSRKVSLMDTELNDSNYRGGSSKSNESWDDAQSTVIKQPLIQEAHMNPGVPSLIHSTSNHNLYKKLAHENAQYCEDCTADSSIPNEYCEQSFLSKESRPVHPMVPSMNHSRSSDLKLLQKLQKLSCEKTPRIEPLPLLEENAQLSDDSDLKLLQKLQKLSCEKTPRIEPLPLLEENAQLSDDFANFIENVIQVL